jgi:hypothetical protein
LQPDRLAESVPGAEVLPVATPLRALLPDGGLRRGRIVRVRSSTALLCALLGEASTRGMWCGRGVPDRGLVAASEAGIDLARLALVPDPGSDLVAVTAAVRAGVELIALAETGRLPAGQRQRLAARAHQRGAVLLPTGSWPGADLELTVTAGRWRGIGPDGHGRLRSRQVQVRATGRGGAYRQRSVAVLLPGPFGAVTESAEADPTSDHATRTIPAGPARRAG